MVGNLLNLELREEYKNARDKLEKHILKTKGAYIKNEIHRNEN